MDGSSDAMSLDLITLTEENVRMNILFLSVWQRVT